MSNEFLQTAEITDCEMQKFAAHVHVCTPDLCGNMDTSEKMMH